MKPPGFKRFAADFKNLHASYILYNAPARSQLEYPSVTWQLLHIKHIYSTEHKFQRFVLFKIAMEMDRLRILALEFLASILALLKRAPNLSMLCFSKFFINDITIFYK